MNQGSEPRLSLVLPTTGSGRSVIRVLRSLIDGAPPAMLLATELIVYLNKVPHAGADIGEIQVYLESIKPLFQSAAFLQSEEAYLTAEESACAAIESATGRYLWIVGDKRILLPEGLRRLARFLADAEGACAYFNSVRQERDGFSNYYTSNLATSLTTELTYKSFVQRTGVNFMATNMGAWVFERRFLDPKIWRQLIETRGPHFSHVFALLAAMGQATVKCFNVFITILELKAYHGGNPKEWETYAALAGCYRFYPWTLGMARLYNYVIENGHFTHADLRRSMTVEATHIGRQADEIYNHLFYQVRLGWGNAKERLTESEFHEVYSLLVRACPERAVVNGLLEDLYRRTRTDPPKNVYRLTRPLFQAMTLDHLGVPLGSLIVGQIADKYIRLHPQGYLLSGVTDREQFYSAYRLYDAPVSHRFWTIVEEDKLFDTDLFSVPRHVGNMFPAEVNRRLVEYPTVIILAKRTVISGLRRVIRMVKLLMKL